MISSRKTPVILDFDGTLADSFEAFVESLQEVLGLKSDLTETDVKELRGLSTREVMARLKIRKWQIPKLVTKGREAMARRIKDVALFDGINYELKKISKDHPIYILSTNDKSSIEYVLKKYRLSKYIIDVQAGIGMLNKKKGLVKLAKRHKLNIPDCIYVGDETRDIDAANGVGMKSIAVTWGFNTKAALIKTSPTKLVDKPDKLKTTIDNVSL